MRGFDVGTGATPSAIAETGCNSTHFSDRVDLDALALLVKLSIAATSSVLASRTARMEPIIRSIPYHGIGGSLERWTE